MQTESLTHNRLCVELTHGPTARAALAFSPVDDGIRAVTRSLSSSESRDWDCAKSGKIALMSSKPSWSALPIYGK
ncbi:MAG: hypothetical protein WBD22_15385 [Pyrinomonadaceae bacterium]